MLSNTNTDNEIAKEVPKKPVRKSKKNEVTVETAQEDKIEVSSKETITPVVTQYNEMHTEINIDALLEKEKQHNKTESWNKLDKTIKMQKLHIFAEKYGKDNSMAVKDIKSLKSFFKDCIEKNKLQKTKDVQYNKEQREIIGIPSLYFNQLNRNYTLKNTDSTRVSTMKSLTPLRSSDELATEEKV